jgi:uncharacterized protein YbjT (DUF2867 family)
VKVLVRDQAKGDPWRARGAEVVLASLDDAEALGQALAGAEGAYLLSPQDMRSPDPITDGWRIADAIARAVAAQATAHLVLLSSIAAPHAEGTGLSRTLHAAEERLAQARTSITFLRAAYLLENWAPVLPAAAHGKLPSFIAPDRVVPMVAARDVGEVAARALLEGPPRAVRDIIELRGPRDHSPRELAAMLATILGRPVDVEVPPLDAVVPIFTGMGASPAFAEQVRLLYQGIADGKLDGRAEGVRALRGSVDAETFFRRLLTAQR